MKTKALISFAFLMTWLIYSTASISFYHHLRICVVIHEDLLLALPIPKQNYITKTFYCLLLCPIFLQTILKLCYTYKANVAVHTYKVVIQISDMFLIFLGKQHINLNFMGIKQHSPFEIGKISKLLNHNQF